MGKLTKMGAPTSTSAMSQVLDMKAPERLPK